MKLYRSDLNAGLHNTLFEIPADSLGLEDFEINRPVITCTLSSEMVVGGYRLSGEVHVPVIETCDRCLDPHQETLVAVLAIFLTSNQELVDTMDQDVVWFPEGWEWIDLRPILYEVINLEKPMKNLCREDCRGLCPQCGTNWNRSSCDCNRSTGDERWSALKDLIS